MLKKERNGWTRGAEDVREGRKEDGGRRRCESDLGGGAVHVESAGQMVRNWLLLQPEMCERTTVLFPLTHAQIGLVQTHGGLL